MVVATVGTGAAAFQIDPEVITRVATATNGIWIPATLSGEIIHVDAATGEVTARVDVARPGAELELAETGSEVVVVDRTAGRVSLVDPALHEVVREVGAVPAGLDLVDIGPDGIVAAAGSEVSMIDLEVTRSTSINVGTEIGSIVASGPGGLAAGGEMVRSFDTTGSEEVDGSAGADARVVRAGELVMVIDGTSLDQHEGSRRSCLNEPLGPDARVIGHESGMVISVDHGLVQMSDLDTGTCERLRIADTDTVLGRPAMAGGFVFVPEPEASSVHIIDLLRRRSTVHRVAFGSSDLRIRSRGEIVVAYAVDTSFAALLDAQGVVSTINTLRTDQPLVAVIGDAGSSAVVGGDVDAPGVGLNGIDGTTQASNELEVQAAVLAATIRNEEEPEPIAEAPSDELVANFAFSADTVAVGTEVRFVDESTGSPRSWIWDFGDGDGAEGPEVSHAWQEAGTYAVTLHVARDDLSAQVSLAIVVIPAEVELPPSADFTVSAGVVSVGDAVAFADRSAGDINRWHWDFGDGTQSSFPNPSKSWDRSGRYTVVLTVANEQGSDSATLVVEVIDELRPPLAVIGASSQLVEVGEPVVFTAVSTTDPALFGWDFGDGQSSTGESVTHVFTEEGTFTVTVLATNDAGSSTAQIEISVVPATVVPVAHIANLPLIIEVGDVVALTSLSSNGPDTEVWSFGDGETASGTTVTHTWASEGMFLVSLTATNGAGSSTSTVMVDVLADLPPPVAVIAGFDRSPWVGEATLFTEASLDATAWSWDFGDGVISGARTPLHTFSTPGPHTVTLTVTNRNGSDSTFVAVDARLRPTAAFAVSPVAPRVGQLVNFTDLSVNATTWSWDFGDGSTSVLKNPTHTYAAQGSYSVQLTISSPTGDFDTTLPTLVVVNPAPPALSGISTIDPATTLDRNTFTAVVGASSGPIDTYEIDYGDGSAIEGSPLSTFQHPFAAAGVYTVRMRARGPLADWSPWISRTLNVVDPAPPLVAIAAAVPLSAPLGFVTLTGEALPGTGPINTWAWEITGTAGTVSLGGREVIHNFTATGTYQLTVRAAGPVAVASATRSITITLPPAPAITALIASPSPATTGSTVQFFPTVTGSVVEWAWDYTNSGTYVPGLNPGATIFNAAGSHTVSLRVTGPHGQTAFASVVVIVNGPPPVVDSISPIVGTTGVPVSFTAGVTGSVVGWAWDFGDLASATDVSSLVSPSYAYPAAGSYTVTLTVTAVDGQTAFASVVVIVSDPPPTVP